MDRLTATRNTNSTATAKVTALRQAKGLLSPEQLLEIVRDAVGNLKANDVTEVDVRGRTSIADYMVIASGTSNRHVKSIADEVIKQAKQAGMMPLGVEGEREGEWILVDLGDVLLHVMLPRTREFYGLERLWSVDGDAEAEHADSEFESA
ncbi:MAG: ribosome silencing factor [Xanthomonadales bacterium]|nr:ribosome silencing factor [Xanthomonadales bacterium]